MSITPTSPLPGSAETGFTSPTYTLVSDVALSANAKQWYVSAKGGTQPAAVDVHSISRPFTLTVVRPMVFKPLGSINPVTGVISSVPRNTWKFITRKGVSPLSGQPDVVLKITTSVEVPAGVDMADPNNLRAALAAHTGLLWDQSANIGDSTNSGTF